MKKIISLFLILFMLSYVGSVVIFDSNHKINQLYFPANNKIFFPIENINLFFKLIINIKHNNLIYHIIVINLF